MVSLVLDHFDFERCSVGSCARFQAHNDAHKGLGYTSNPFWTRTNNQTSLKEKEEIRINFWYLNPEE